ncbi:hypothetical protein L3Q65_00315 (plasmid) [Amycolatopsis sp. FU40]|uniref:hypothetical protein n=1 Tax=Amycolatopsis sp. FU40 TaxID=2914159 RepID=UPI001F2D0DBE|nr:hypothetical protein [Amycolatopsis sp. FU40]UKD50773.1 hypothetical protein L3Q65_00315 [Amycolatopsis sp. FU40]
MLDLEPFRTAETIRWVRHTEFVPHSGDDGNLVTGTGQSIPLDTWTPQSRPRWNPRSDERENVARPPVSDQTGMVSVDPETLDDVHSAIRAWCEANLGRTDVIFDD